MTAMYIGLSINALLSALLCWAVWHNVRWAVDVVLSLLMARAFLEDLVAGLRRAHKERGR